MQILANGLFSGAQFACLALAFYLINKAQQFLDFSLAATVTVSAYVASAIARCFDVPFFVVVVLGALCGGIVGVLFDLCAFRPLRKNEASSLVKLLASCGLMIAGINAVSMICGDSPQLFLETVEIRSVFVLASRLTWIQIGTFFVAFFVFGGCWILLQWTKWGISLRALASDTQLAGCVGINTTLSISIAVGIASCIAGLVATLSGMDTGIAPSIGFKLLFPSVVAYVVGGMGRLSGAFLGGFAVGIIQQYAGWYFGAAWQDAVLFFLLCLFLFLKPQGLFTTPLSHADV